jgi:hypothetical protein
MREQNSFCRKFEPNRQILILKSRKLKLGRSSDKVDAKVYLHYLDMANPCKGNTDLYLEDT